MASVDLADGDQEAGRLGDREGQQAVERRPGSTMTPSIHCQASRPPILPRWSPSASLQDAVVDQLGDGDADDDRGLLEGGEPAAVGGRGDLGDVGGADDGGHADGEAADDPPEGQVPQGEGQGRADGADR